MSDTQDTNAAARGSALTEGLGPLLDEWADAAGVTFEERAIGPTLTRSMVARNDLLQLMRAVQAAERERWEAAVAIAQQCIYAAYNDHWASFEALSEDFDNAVSAAKAGPNVL